MNKPLTQLLTDPIVVAVVVPILLFLAGGFGKKLVRGGNDWHRKDFYLGVDAMLATISAALIHIFDITKSMTQSNVPENIEKLIASGVFLGFSFFLYMIVLGIHQNWESKTRHRAKQWLWLVIVSNSIGLGLM
ncbi:MAG: hypothetical protein ACPGWR_06525 [Ardenticatenaceae bacterium]